MAATRGEKNNALLALTSAALSLPGINSQAAVPVTQAQGSVQYGYYQESDDRMKVEVYHGDFTLPVTDRLEFTFSVDRDTYSGATPAFSLPATLTNQYKSAGEKVSKVDVVSAASGGVNAQELTVLGGLNNFNDVFGRIASAKQIAETQKDSFFKENSAAVENEKQQAINQFLIDNPKPDFPASIPGAVTITFGTGNAMPAAVYGKPNLNVGGSTDCAVSSCYQEGGFVVGTIRDFSVSNPLLDNSHLHRAGTASDRAVQYHGDSSGIYLRAVNGEAFSALNMDVRIEEYPGTDPDKDYWEILGFNTAVNPNLSIGDGTTEPNRVAYQKVFNTHTGILALDQAFENINALWIHYKGFVKDVVNSPGNDFSLSVDTINLSKAQFPDETPEQKNWRTAYEQFIQSLNNTYAPEFDAIAAQADTLRQETEKHFTIAAYREFLNRLVPPKSKPVQRFQTQPVETRTMPVFGAKYYLDNTTLSFSGGQSNEPDFHSTFGSFNYSQEFNHKLTTLSAGYSYTDNEITRNTGAHTSHHSSDPSHNPADYPDLNANSHFHSFNTGLTQILGKNTLFQLSGNYTRQSGYLTNPYKFVYIRGEITPEEYYELSQATTPGTIDWGSITKLEVVGLELFREVRPDVRNQFSVSTRLNQYLPALDAAVHVDYRFYADDWDVHSHTVQLQWLQKFPWGLTVTPNLRYYSQTQADFFAPYFLTPRADGHYSSDFRLSAYGALSGGLNVTKQFNRGIRLELGVEYYTHQGDLKLGGGGESDYADFSYWMTHANLSVDLSAPGQLFSDSSESDGHDRHHLHHHHASLPPAGIMFGHMIDKIDSIMVGYRYTYTNQTGDILNGSRAVSDRFLLGQTCGETKCTTRPTEMSMQMHMLDLMYAPTDWLNVMVMPQLMDMKMNLRELPGVSEESAHGGSHESHGLGDTWMAVMLKVFSSPGHHVHVGLGASAPTGDVDVTLDGRDTPESELQDYGMQLGSGTWDFLPSLTYSGDSGDWSWGMQLSGTKRLEHRNDSGYVLGDRFQTTFWGSYRFTRWLSTSLRGIYTEQGKIRGQFNRLSAEGATVDSPANYGGKFWDIGFGLNLTVPSGVFAGHNFSVEWQQPVADKFNGLQLEREGSLAATWSYAF